MSARAAARLEWLGFRDVLRYTAGKADWAANGLPTDGAAQRTPRISAVVRADATVCSPDDRLGDVQPRAYRAGADRVVVLNPSGIVLGVLDQEALRRPAEIRAEEAMASGPLTLRPNVPVDTARDRLDRSGTDAALVTTTGGELIGVLHRADLDRLARAA